MNSDQTTFYFGSRPMWKGYTDVDDRRMLPYVDPSAWMSFLLPWRTQLRHYMPRPLPSYWLPYDASRRDEKRNMFIFRRSRIEAESKSNCSQIVILITMSQSNRSRIAIVVAALMVIHVVRTWRECRVSEVKWVSVYLSVQLMLFAIAVQVNFYPADELQVGSLLFDCSNTFLS